MSQETGDLVVHIDGGSRGNPGPSGAGVVIRDARSHGLLHEAGYFFGHATGNVAEYRGLIRALELAHELSARSTRIHSDSQLLVRQIQGDYQVKAPHLRPLFNQAKGLLRRLGSWQIQHVRREENHRADQLANMAMDAGTDVLLTGQTNGGGADPGPSTRGSKPDVLCWTVRLSGPNGRCLAGTTSAGEYVFGPTTAEGLCVHAAAAALTDGPLQWPRSKRTGQTRCRACGLTIKLARLV